MGQHLYQSYQEGGEAWATLAEDVMPGFVSFLESHTLPERSVFDVGVGTGKYLAFLEAQGFAVAGIDSSPTAITIAKELLQDSANLTQADMFTHQLPRDSYGLIISVSTIHHGLPANVADLVARLYDALLPGGWVFITVPDYDAAVAREEFVGQQQLADQTWASTEGPEAGLPHSFYDEEGVRELFARYNEVTTVLDDIGRWVVTAQKARD